MFDEHRIVIVIVSFIVDIQEMVTTQYEKQK